MEFKEIDMKSLNLSRARSLNHAIFLSQRDLYTVDTSMVKRIWLRLRANMKFNV